MSSALTLNQLFIVIAPTLFGFMVNVLNSYQLALVIVSILVALGAVNLYRMTLKNVVDENVLFIKGEE